MRCPRKTSIQNTSDATHIIATDQAITMLDTPFDLPETMLQSARTTASDGSMTWDFPVEVEANDELTVDLYFAEFDSDTGSGDREFDILIEDGETWEEGESDYDIYADVGAFSAAVKSYTVTFGTADTALSITLDAATTTSSPLICGIQITESDGTVLYSINVGGSSILAGGWSGNATNYLTTGYSTASTTSTIAADGEALANLSYGDLPMELFQSALQSSTSTMGWEFYVGANASVDITLYFAEIDDAIGTGDRIFDIQIEGSTVEDDFDIYEECLDMGDSSGLYEPVAKTFTVTVGADGILDIDLLSEIGSPLLCGIEIYLP